MLKFILTFHFFLFNFFGLSFASEQNYFTSTGNYQSHRYSYLDQINLENIDNLKVAWIFKNDLEIKDDPTVANALTPVITDKSLIFGTLDNYLVSLNPKSGQINWKKKYNGYKGIAKRGITFKEINFGNESKKVIFIPTNKTILAIDPNNGQIVNSLGDQGKFGENGSGLAPIVIDNKIFISSSSKIESYEINNYKKNWSANLNGARVWSGFSYDKITNSLIVTTSDPADLIYSRTKEPDYFNSLVILDALNGKIRCSFQDVKFDHWDLDMVGHPIVVNNINGDQKNIVFGFSKTGNTIVADLNTCELHFDNSFKNSNALSPDHSLKNVNYSKVQKEFLKPEPISSVTYDFDSYLDSIDDINKKNYISHKLRYSKYNSKYIPLSLNYDSTLIGLHGGPQWPGGSFDKLNNQIIVTTNHDPWIIRAYYQDQIYRLKKGLNIRIKRFIDKYEFLSNYKKRELLDKNLNQRIKRYVDSEDYYSSYKIIKGVFYLFDQLYFNSTKFLDFSGSKIYKNKCLSCHGYYRQEYFETEFTGDEYVPSLTNLSQLERFNSMENTEDFQFSHKYIENKIKITNDELLQVKNYFQKVDKVLNKLDLIHIGYKWQVILDNEKLPASVQPWGKISAIDIETGKLNWSIPSGYTISRNKKIPGSTNFGGLLSTKSNILFSTGTSDEKIYAYKSSDGDQIWSYKLPASGSSAPMTYEMDGIQYILVNASGGRYYNYKKSNSEYLVAFKLESN